MSRYKAKDVLVGNVSKIILINNKNKKFDIKKELISMQYYEDIFSPCVTATLTLLDAELSKTVELTGGESVILEFNNPLCKNIVKNAFVVDKIEKVSNISTATLNYINLQLITVDDKVNYFTKITKTYEGTYDNIVKEVLDDLEKKVLGESDIKDKDAVQDLNLIKKKNLFKADKKFKFNVNYKSPYQIISKYLNRATYKEKEKERYGYLFYENRNGYNLQPINELAKKEPMFYFTKSVVNAENVPMKDKMLAIESYNVVSSNNMTANSIGGVYASRQIVVDPFKGYYKEELFNISKIKDELTNLGTMLPKVLTEYEHDNRATRTFVYLVNPGVYTLDESKNQYEVSRDGFLVPSIMRYNMLLFNKVEIYIPGNTDVTIGDVVNIALPEKKINSKNEDPILSGKYLVAKLCHSIQGEVFKTFLTLVRDTIGNQVK